jgi:hypothetical protein
LSAKERILSDFKSTKLAVLDPDQLKRIEAEHSGFLYQHLYAAACLMLAQNAEVVSIVVECDEDVEINFPDRRFYIQVKTRANPLVFSDIAGALQRFDSLRLQHQAGDRANKANFIIASNIQPGASLLERIGQVDWPSDVEIHWPDCPVSINAALPMPWHNIPNAIAWCAELADTLPYSILAPETLVWKLTGLVMLAATGKQSNRNHSFQTSELFQLFEQIVVQLQDFPTPPEVYRSQTDEPAILTSAKTRIISGYSGSGKTSWVSQASVHTNGIFTYFDVSETPGPALSSALSRDLAARLFGKKGGVLGEILLPGASGIEILQSIGRHPATKNQNITIVLDNAHCVPPSDLHAIIKRSGHLKFILLCQPDKNVQELEALLAITAEQLRGWDTDTIAKEVSFRNCRGDLMTCQRLLELTDGVPLYVQNALEITSAEYNGSLQRFCDDLEAKTHIVKTAQEIILSHVFNSFSPQVRDGIGVLSISDIPLEKDEASILLANVLNSEEQAVAELLRQLRSDGSLKTFGGGRFKIHDAMRLVAQSHLEAKTIHNAQVALKNIISASLQRERDLPKLSLYLRMLAATDDIKTLVQFVTDELFHELGIKPEIMKFLENASIREGIEPEDRFWSLDALIFSDMKQGNYMVATERLKIMENLLVQHNFSAGKRLVLEMKRMNLLAYSGQTNKVLELSERPTAATDT